MLGEQIRRERTHLLLPVLLVLLAVNGAMALLAWQDWRERVAEAQGRARVAVQLVMQRAEAQFNQMNTLLSGISEVISARGGMPTQPDNYLHRLLVRRHTQVGGIHWLFLVRMDGVMAESSNRFPAAPLDLKDRAYFSLQMEHWDLGLYVGEPLVGRGDNVTFIPVSRRVANDGGRMLGVVAAGLDPATLERLLQSQSLPAGFVAGIFLDDGAPLACVPAPCNKEAVAATPLFREHLATQSIAQVTGKGLLDTEPAVGSYMASALYPLVVAVQVSETVLRQEWQAALRGFLPLVLGANLAVFGLAFLAHRQFLRRQEALLALETANAALEQRVEERTARLQASEAQARAFMNTAMDAVVVIDAQSRILEFNPAAERMFAYTGSEVRGQPLGLLMPEGMHEEHARNVQSAGDQESARPMGRGREVLAQRRDGTRFPVEVTVGSVIRGADMIHVGIIRDITERKEAEWQLQRLATIDSLTGVFNRRAFMEQGEQMLGLARRYQWPLAVMMLDADRFKSVNDTYGHHVGDEVLKLLAALAGSVLRSTDILGRLGGEEFGLVLPETGADGARELGERLLQQIREAGLPLEGGEILRMTVSIGVACLAPGDSSLDDLFRRADACLYRAKHEGRDRLVMEPAAPEQG